MDDTASAIIQIKGIRDGLLITLGQEEWEQLKTTLLRQIDERAAFFSGARLALDVGTQVLRVAELSALRDQLSDRGIMLWAVLSESPKTEQTAQNLGLATRITKTRPEETRPALEAISDETALWVKHTVRSGTRVEFPRHVVVFGDVNPGAEVVAGGSVIVWGRLRGVVHAGAQGDVTAVVCALEMRPTQLRIAGEIAISPKEEGETHPEIACLRDGRLVAEPWQA